MFVRRDFAGLGDGHSFRQKKTAAITRIADAFWNSRAPGNPSSLKGILKRQSNVEFLLAQFAHRVFFSVHKHRLVANLLILIDCRHIWPRKYRYLGFRKPRSHSTQSRQRHDGVADPVRGANQDFHADAPRGNWSFRSIAARNSLSAVRTKSIAATKIGIVELLPAAKFSASFSVVTNAIAPAALADFSNR